jgi:hypothetical protein
MKIGLTLLLLDFGVDIYFGINPQWRSQWIGWKINMDLNFSKYIYIYMEGVEQYKIGVETMLAGIKSNRERQKLLSAVIKNEWNEIRLAGIFDLFVSNEEKIDQVLEVVYLLTRLEYLVKKLE